MLITTSAVTGGFPKPALPPLVFRSIYQMPPPSPARRVKRAEKAARSAVPSLSVAPVGRPGCSARSHLWSPVTPRAPRAGDVAGRAQRLRLAHRAGGSRRSSRGPESARSVAAPPRAGRQRRDRGSACGTGGSSSRRCPRGPGEGASHRGEEELLCSGTGLQRLLFEHTRCLLLGKAAQAMGLPDNSN